MTALSRRSLFGGFAGLLVAPAIVRASSIMEVKPVAGATLAYPATLYEAMHSWVTRASLP